MVLDRHARNVHQQLSKINLFFGPSLYLLRRLLKDSDQKIDSVYFQPFLCKQERL